MKLQLNKYLLVFFLFLFLVPAGQPLAAENEKYDLAYIWDRDIHNVLDYKEKLEELFVDPKIRMRIIVVKRKNEYGIVYDRNGTASSVRSDKAFHSKILKKAGLDEPHLIKDEGYHRLYNVSYGIGPNVEALKKKYNIIYGYFGKGVGKDLCIEQISENNYSLIYRRRGDRRSTAVVARRHSRELKRKGISATIISENNNPVVFGESSLLHEGEFSTKTTKNEIDNPTVASVAVSPPVKKVPGKNGLSQGVPILKDITKTYVDDQPAKSGIASRAKNSVAVSGGSLVFEQPIEVLIKSLRRKGVISRDERTGWVVYDLENDTTLVDINGNSSFQAASMIKPFLALAFFHQVKQKKFVYGPKSRRKMVAMIQRSSNTAANWVMRQVGGPVSVQRILKNNYPHIFKNTSIVEYIPAGGRTYRNKAVPSDYIRFLRALWNKELPYGKEMRRLMALPGRDRLYHGTPIPQGTLVYNKTGSTAHLCGDMGILVPRSKNGKRYPYAIVGIIERRSRPANYGRWVMARSRVIRQVSTLVYKELKKDRKLL